MRVRAATLNIHGTEDLVGRQEIINATLRRLEPDVVSLQEVASAEQLDAVLDGTGLHGTHQSQVLAYEPPDHLAACRSSARPKRRQLDRARSAGSVFETSKGTIRCRTWRDRRSRVMCSVAGADAVAAAGLTGPKCPSAPIVANGS